MSQEGSASLRLDKWLWYARFFKSRALASSLCQSGKLRLGGQPVSKAHRPVNPGDVLTFPQGRQIRVVKVLALASRRGPATEAQALYEDLAPPTMESRLPSHGTPAVARRAPGQGRPTKRERRQIDRLQPKES